MIVNFELAKLYGPNLLDPKAGEALYGEMADALRRGDRVVLDFENVAAVLSAFFNPAIGRLYAEFPAETLRENLSMSNDSPAHRKVVGIVVANAKRHAHDGAYAEAERAAIDKMINS